jgi:hypothetical protein
MPIYENDFSIGALSVRRATQLEVSEMNCPSCRKLTLLGDQFCSACGRSLNATSGEAIAPNGDFRDIARAIHREKTGGASAFLVFILGAILCWFGWNQFGRPAWFINSFVQTGDCGDSTIGTWQMYLCAASVALRTALGSIVLMVIFLFCRQRLIRAGSRLVLRTAVEMRFLVRPLISTFLFVILWAGAHQETSELSGLISQKIFPAVLGLFVFFAARYGKTIHTRLIPFWVARNQRPKWLRIVVAIALSLTFAFWLTDEPRVSMPAMKEQIIVIASLVMGYLALGNPKGEKI